MAAFGGGAGTPFRGDYDRTGTMGGSNSGPMGIKPGEEWKRNYATNKFFEERMIAENRRRYEVIFAPEVHVRDQPSMESNSLGVKKYKEVVESAFQKKSNGMTWIKLIEKVGHTSCGVEWPGV